MPEKNCAFFYSGNSRAFDINSGFQFESFCPYDAAQTYPPSQADCQINAENIQIKRNNAVKRF